MTEPKRKKWNWRKFLTRDEAAFMRDADAGSAEVAKAQSAWNAKYQLERMKIVNRAIQRAKYYEANSR
jgi:hypothetical protein